jgi:hypothetical protein
MFALVSIGIINRDFFILSLFRGLLRVLILFWLDKILRLIGHLVCKYLKLLKKYF